MTRTRRLMRIIGVRRAVLSLAGGGAVAVLVAWGLQIRGYSAPTRWTPRTAPLDGGYTIRGGRFVQAWSLDRSSPGISAVRAWVRPFEVTEARRWPLDSESAREAPPPGWTAPLLRDIRAGVPDGGWPSGQTFGTGRMVAAGWPLRCARSWAYDPVLAPSTTVEIGRHVFGRGPSWLKWREIALHPIPLGLAGNAAVFAVPV